MDQYERNVPTVDHDLSTVFKIHCDPPVDIGLDLAQPPIRRAGMTNQLPGFKQGVPIIHPNLILQGTHR